MPFQVKIDSGHTEVIISVTGLHPDIKIKKDDVDIKTKDIVTTKESKVSAFLFTGLSVPGYPAEGQVSLLALFSPKRFIVRLYFNWGLYGLLF